MNHSKILCSDLAEFVSVCADLARANIVFEGHADRLVIYVTGY